MASTIADDGDDVSMGAHVMFERERMQGERHPFLLWCRR